MPDSPRTASGGATLISWRQAALELTAFNIPYTRWPLPFERSPLKTVPERLTLGVYSVTLCQRCARWNVPAFFGRATCKPDWPVGPEFESDGNLRQISVPTTELNDATLHWIDEDRIVTTELFFLQEEVQRATGHGASPELRPLLGTLRPWRPLGAQTFVNAYLATEYLKSARICPNLWPSLYWRLLGTSSPLEEAPRGMPGKEHLHDYWISKLFFKGTVDFADRWLPSLPLHDPSSILAQSRIELFMMHDDVSSLLRAANFPIKADVTVNQLAPAEAPAGEQPIQQDPRTRKHSIFHALRPRLESHAITAVEQLRTEMHVWCRQNLATDAQPTRATVIRWAQELWQTFGNEIG